MQEILPRQKKLKDFFKSPEPCDNIEEAQLDSSLIHWPMRRKREGTAQSVLHLVVELTCLQSIKKI